MKSLVFIYLLINLLITAYCGSYENAATHYGCSPLSDKDCYSQNNPKCGNGLPSDKYFAALPEKYVGNKQHCDDYVVLMTTDTNAISQSKTTMVKAKIVDQCGGCHETQVDLSFWIWNEFSKSSSEGVHDVVWVIISKEGEVLIDPVGSFRSLESISKLSSSELKEVFLNRAKKMVTSSLSTSKWPWLSSSSSLSSSEEKKDNSSNSKTTITTTVTKTKTKTYEASTTSTTSTILTTTSITTTTSSTPTTTSVSDAIPTLEVTDDKHKKYRCGEGFNNSCQEGYCCSSHGYCGTAEGYCGNGCQKGFGNCWGACGKEHGNCPEGYCCSKFGYCGKSEKYCGKGCQSEFGKCY